MTDSDPEGISAFLADLESTRGNCPATRNVRLAALHAFMRFVGAQYPEHLEICQRILAVSFKRAPLRVIDYLEEDEIRALLDAPDRAGTAGRRDHALLLAMFNTGARVQEILDLQPCDLQLTRPL